MLLFLTFGNPYTTLGAAWKAVRWSVRVEIMSLAV